MKRSAVILFVFAVLLLFSWGFYQWFYCRFYVPPKYMAVVTAKTGKTPAPGKILVERGEKGIWREVLPEGRHFRFGKALYPALGIRDDALFLTSRYGAALGDFVTCSKGGVCLYGDIGTC